MDNETADTERAVSMLDCNRQNRSFTLRHAEHADFIFHQSFCEFIITDTSQYHDCSPTFDL